MQYRLFFWVGCLMAIPALAGAADPYAWAKDHHLFAHAMGRLNGHDYTNCLEAFTTNYAKGQRIFECDVTPTSDGNRVLIHDWRVPMMGWLGLTIPPGRENLPMSTAQFKSQKILGAYTPLSFQDVVQLLHNYPDAYLVTDTKATTTTADIKRTFTIMRDCAYAVDPTILDRILPEIDAWGKKGEYTNMYYTVMAVYPFKSVLFCFLDGPDTPDTFLAYMKKTGIRAASIPTGWATPAFLAQLKSQGYYSFIYGDPSVTDDITQVRGLMNNGATGVYTDILLPMQITWLGARRWMGYE